MAWYDGTHTCGHEGRINVVGPTKDRQWKVDNHFEKLCSECWEIEKQRRFNEENQKAAEAAAEMELPVLTGSEKQVSWANTLRQKNIEKLERLRERIKPEKLEETMLVWDRLLLKQTSAKYWIENLRNVTSYDLEEVLIKEYELYQKEQEQNIVPEAVKQEALEDMTIRPSEPTTSLVTEIKIKDTLVTARYPERNEGFNIVR